MAVLKILTIPNPILREQATVVTSFDSNLHQILDDMTDTMYAARGIGLAAPQVGILQRIAVIDTSENKSEKIEFINPEIIAASGSTKTEEGCLSIPKYREYVNRKEKVVVRAMDRLGKQFQIEADDLFAICIQHEMDHLNGVLFIDRLSALKRQLFKRWFDREYPGDE